MPSTEQADKKLIDQAIQGGATAAKIISANRVVIAQWVRHKCQFGCRMFAKRFTCPPYVPSPVETVETVKSYQRALLVEFRDRHFENLGVHTPNHSIVHRTMYNLERQAFLDGLYRATAYAAGPCHLCPECPAEKLEKPSLFNKKDCLNSKMARPSMEAAGIDVYQTVRQAGFEIHVVLEKSEPYTSFGLVLLE